MKARVWGQGRRPPGGLRVAVVALATLAAALGLVVGALANLTVSAPDADPAPAGPAATASVTVSPNGPAVRVPASFLGFSTEYWTLPFWERRPDVAARVLALIHVPGDPPLVLRIGGDSADHSFWETAGQEVPEWAFELTPSWLEQTRALVRRSRLHVILDLNVVTASPRIAATWAQVASRQLPRGSVVGFEIGNEPDIYSRGDWLAVLRGVSDARTILPLSISPARYARDYLGYARAIDRFAPAVPLLGPAVANPVRHLGWIALFLRGPRPGLGAVTAHRYPYSECSFPGTHGFATIARLLSEQATAGMAGALRPAVRLAHRADLPFRLTELNSVTCGGRPGVSNTFATALWAPDALFELIRAGVDAADVHVREHTVNAAFVVTPQGLEARPLLYGLILFVHTLGPGAELVPTRVHATRPAHLKAWAVRVRGDVVHVLLIDKGAAPIRVALRLPATGGATVQRLLAPSISARMGVTLGGQWLGSAATWTGTPRRGTLRRTRSGYLITLPRHSAALIVARFLPSSRPARPSASSHRAGRADRSRARAA
jgi:hypothetical protein